MESQPSEKRTREEVACPKGNVVVRAPRIMTINFASIILAVILALASILVTVRLLDMMTRSDAAHDTYEKCEDAATELMIASDFLTTESRMAVVLGDRGSMEAYIDEFFVKRTRDNAVALLSSESHNDKAASRLAEAFSESNDLASIEMYAMRLTADALGMTSLPEELARIELKSNDAALSIPEKRAVAENLVLGEDYQALKREISSDVDTCVNELVRDLEQNVFDVERRIDELLFALIVISCLLLALVVFTVLTNYYLILSPLKQHSDSMAASNPLKLIGGLEIQNFATSYNELYEETRRKTDDLRRQAETDPLTGALNRSSYDKLVGSPEDGIALVLADVDDFKAINDSHGHGVGDGILKKVAESLTNHFRTTDYVCRIGGDEFAVVLTRVKPDSSKAIAAKLDAIAKDLSGESGELPSVTLSFGVAFKDEHVKGEDDLYHNADKALYESKRKGRNTVSFFNG